MLDIIVMLLIVLLSYIVCLSTYNCIKGLASIFNNKYILYTHSWSSAVAASAGV